MVDSRIQLGSEQLDVMVKFCATSGRKETGGILVGKYDRDQKRACISIVSDAPDDSHRGQSTFFRGTRSSGLAESAVEQKQGYYLGEWHYHPFALHRGQAQLTWKQMQNVEEDSGHHCPEPIMLILGGDPKGSWTIRAFVFQGKTHGKNCIRQTL